MVRVLIGELSIFGAGYRFAPAYEERRKGALRAFFLFRPSYEDLRRYARRPSSAFWSLMCTDVFSATAARMSAWSAFSSILSPSWKSMARLVLPSRLELKRPEGSLSEAPLAKVIFTTFLYVSPVQIIPACDHTGTPDIEFDGFFHFNSSTTSGSACLMRIRIRASVSPRQSVCSLILASINWAGGVRRPAPSAFPPFPSFE